LDPFLKPLPVQEQLLRVPESPVGAEKAVFCVTIKKRGFKGNAVVQGGVLASGGRSDRGKEPTLDAYLSVGVETGVVSGLIFPDGGQKAQHTLLDQILTVAPRQKVRAGADTHQTAVPDYQRLLRVPVPLGDQSTERFVRLLVRAPGINFHERLSFGILYRNF
jgi:hypothetical protein